MAALLLVLAAGFVLGQDDLGEDAPPEPGLVERIIERLTGGDVVIRGLGGSLTKLRAELVELRDPEGTWLVINDLFLDWAPLRVLTAKLLIERLVAGKIELKRPQVSEESSSPPTLPLEITVRSLDVKRFAIDPAVAGEAAAFALTGSAHLESLEQGSLTLDAQALDSAGRYQIEGRFDPESLRAQLRAEEPANGPLARLAGIPDIGAIALDAELAGPRSALVTALDLAAGPLQAQAQGTVDLENNAADLMVSASAPAMSPRPDLSWQSVSLDASVSGPFTQPVVEGTLRIVELSAAGAEVRAIAAGVQGDSGQVQLRASLVGVNIPGPDPDLLAEAPLVVRADVRLDAPDRPVTFALEHPLLAAEGRALTADAIEAAVELSLPELAPLAAVAGMDIQGRAQWTVQVAQEADATKVEATGTLGITGGTAPLPGLLGESARIVAAATVQGQTVTLSELRVDGEAIELSAQGGLGEQGVELDWQVALSELQVLEPTLSGAMTAKGQVTGPTDDFALEADLSGELGVRDLPPRPITARVQAEGLPAAPSGEIVAQGTLGGAPLELALRARRSEAGATEIDIARADWKSAHAEGQLTLASGAYFPIGTLEVRMTRLGDLEPLIGQLLTGSVTASLTTAEQDGKTRARIALEARDTGLPDTAMVDRLTLAGTVVEPTGKPVVDATLIADGIAAQDLTGSARVEVNGPPEALALELAADVPDLEGSPVRLTSSAVLDVPDQQIAVSALEASWKGETLRLLEPVQVAFAEGLSVDELRLGIQQAVLAVSGRLTPTLDLTAQVRNLTPALASSFVPDLKAAGTLQAEARLAGTLAQPTGTVRLEGEGLRMLAGPASALPPASLAATAALAGDSAQLDSRLSVGPQTALTVNGRVPLRPEGALDLRADGTVHLALLDPILTAAGRRVLGRLAVDAGVEGTLADPVVTGTIELAEGEFQDYGQGIRLSGASALIRLEGETLRIARFSANAGPGTLSAEGTIGILSPDMPVDITITARNARPLASDLLTATLNADLAVTGQLVEQFLLAGKVRIEQAEIRIPETLPPSVATLDVRLPGEAPPAPPSAGPTIRLDLTIVAPREIYVRGRGLDAELGGRVQVGGTVADPRPVGGFELRRGRFTLANQTLDFSEGEVSFRGGSLTDPSIDFTVTSTSGDVTAELQITGTVSDPEIRLSSTPELPQDEVLAQLLFGRSASSLSPFEIAQIASALAQLTGVTSGTIDPLGRVRETLGLSELTVGTSAAGDPTLEAGRYIAPRVYFGVEQGAKADSTEAKVQVDLTRHLKLKATVGAAPASATGSASGETRSTVGVMYEFEY